MLRKKLILLLTIFNSIKPTKFEQNCICYQPIIKNLTNPLSLIFINQSHAILAEHHGLILAFNLQTNSSTLILNLSTEIFYKNSQSEVGLLGLAVNPRRNLTEDWIYVSISKNMTSLKNNINHQTVVKRYKFNFNSLKVLSTTDGEEIFNIDQPSDRNNGGHLFFDDDGGLFVTVGDGGLDGNEAIMELSDGYLGTITRIDTKKENKKKILVSGFENPWRCSYGNKRIFCGDVGRHGVEKIWLIENKEKFQIHVHKAGDQSVVIGGFYYVGKELLFLKDRYLFGDYIHGSLHALAQNQNTKEWDEVDVNICRHCQSEHHILAFADDEFGNIYVLTSTQNEQGVVYKLVKQDFNSGKSSSSPNFLLFISIFVLTLRSVN